MPMEWDDKIHSDKYKIRGVLFSKVIKQKITEGSSKRSRERVTIILPEIVPLEISLGCTSSKISVPIPNQPALRMRMGFQGPTLQLVVYLHTYSVWNTPSTIDYYNECCMYNWYDAWKWNVDVEDLIKVSASDDKGTEVDTKEDINAYNANPKIHGYEDPLNCDLDSELSYTTSTAYSALLQIKPDTYWWVRKKDIRREAGWHDKFRMELTLERSWQWSTTGRQRPARDIDLMACFKDGEIGYNKMITEYTGD